VEQYHNALNDRPVEDLSPETWRYLICKEFKFDYWTYEQQPQEWIDEVKLHWVEEAQVKKQRQNVGSNSNDNTRLGSGRLYRPR
jgi:hypothetical protein